MVMNGLKIHSEGRRCEHGGSFFVVLVTKSRRD